MLLSDAWLIRAGVEEMRLGRDVWTVRGAEEDEQEGYDGEELDRNREEHVVAQTSNFAAWAE